MANTSLGIPMIDHMPIFHFGAHKVKDVYLNNEFRENFKRPEQPNKEVLNTIDIYIRALNRLSQKH